jgi:hypothetical protein
MRVPATESQREESEELRNEELFPVFGKISIHAARNGCGATHELEDAL